MKFHFSQALIFALFFLAFSCQKDKNEIIPIEVRDYVDSFFIDAQKKGLNFDRSELGLSIEFAEIDGPLIDGQCNQSTNTVIIDSFFWNHSTDSEKKWLIYHELGHCVLGREHDNSSFINGECKTIMHGNYNESNCSSNFISDSWVEYYTDELFTMNSFEPSWYSLDTAYRSIVETDCFLLDTLSSSDRFSFEFKVPSMNSDFQIEVVFQDRAKIGGSITCIWDDIYSVNTRSRNKINIKRKVKQGNLNLHETYFRKDESEELRDTMKISIRKQNDFFYYYVDERLHHISDFNSIEIFNVYFSSIIDKVKFQFKYCEII